MKAKESQIGERCQQEKRFVSQILGGDVHPGESGSRMCYIKKGCWKACPLVPQTVGTRSQGCVSYGSAGEKRGLLISRIWILPFLKTKRLLSINFPLLTFGIATQFTGFMTSPFNMISQFKQENHNSGSNRNKGGTFGKALRSPGSKLQPDELSVMNEKGSSRGTISGHNKHFFRGNPSEIMHRCKLNGMVHSFLESKTK